MFLHIGKNYIINQKDIIGIFNLKTLENINKIKEINEVIDISDGKPKSLILTIENNVNKIYITKISTITLENRTN